MIANYENRDNYELLPVFARGWWMVSCSGEQPPFLSAGLLQADSRHREVYNNIMIGLMSDSHDNLPAIRKAVELFNRLGCSLVVHAGDVVAPFAARELQKLNCPVKAVFGNCDGEKEGLSLAFKEFGQIAAGPLAFNHAGLLFYVSHYPVERPAEGARVVVFGHTHRAQVNRDGNLVVVNPGEVCGWVKGVSTVALLDPVTLVVDIIPL